MTRIESLREKVKDLYEAKSPQKDKWADWMYQNHVFVVAEYARSVAERHGARAELAEAAGMLHDIADAVMGRENSAQEEKSLEIARKLLTETGFNKDEIKIIVDDAIRFHSCHGEDAPKSLEGKAMATGDALGHLKENFYEYGVQLSKDKGENLQEVKEWGLSKINRDFYKKISFEDVRDETRSDYERVKQLFESL